MSGVPGAAAGWVHFVALTLAVGAVAFRLGVLGRAQRLDQATREGLALGAARMVALASVGVGIGLCLLLVRQADELRFPGDPWGETLRFLFGTPWADAWGWAVGGSLLLTAGSLLALRWGRTGWGITVLALIPLVLFPGLIGHANAADPRLRALAIDALHVTAAGVWIGGLGTVLLMGRGWLDRLVPAFSPLAIGAVATLVVTGGLASWREVETVQALWGTGYGRTLSLKVALFGGVALLGLINWRKLTPRLGSPEGDDAMRRSATLEFLLGNLILLITALLVRMSPGG